jgi:hypothetical protein
MIVKEFKKCAKRPINKRQPEYSWLSLFIDISR